MHLHLKWTNPGRKTAFFALYGIDDRRVEEDYGLETDAVNNVLGVNIDIEDTDGAYRAALDRLVEAEAELKKAFTDSADILDEYQTVDIKLHNLSNRNEFHKGLKVGALLVLEMLKPIK